MPMAVRPPGPHPTAVPRSGDQPAVGDHQPLDGLLPSGGTLAPAPAPAPLWALALDALQLRRGLRDPHRPVGWADSAFASEVDLVRCHLAPLRSRRSLTASFGREGFQSLGLDGTMPRPLGPVRAAYAVRWLELGSGATLPPWPRLVRMDGRAE